MNIINKNDINMNNELIQEENESINVTNKTEIENELQIDKEKYEEILKKANIKNKF